MGVKEQLIFPEINYDDVDKVRGMDIIFVTTAKTDEEARELLRLLGMPFAQNSVGGRISWQKEHDQQAAARRPKFSTRAYTRCRMCGRPHAVLRKYGICRICFPRAGLQGTDPWRPQGQLVSQEKEVATWY